MHIFLNHWITKFVIEEGGRSLTFLKYFCAFHITLRIKMWCVAFQVYMHLVWLQWNKCLNRFGWLKKRKCLAFSFALVKTYYEYLRPFYQHFAQNIGNKGGFQLCYLFKGFMWKCFIHNFFILNECLYVFLNSFFTFSVAELYIFR